MVESSALQEFEGALIDDAWQCVVNRTSIQRNLSSSDLEKLPDLLKLLEIMNNLDRSEEAVKLLHDSSLSKKNQEQILSLRTRKRKKTESNWNVDVMVGNSLIHKSLHLKVSLPVGPHVIEMTVEKFGTLR
ncbi:unnamed protein product [Anisakis simplex]|uniref:COMM domain-containing protein n=1 Tax=Anisakis simplex TaxID=6269 RepID=A0A0M3K0L3_ANISI|nr:unnamed protein product [Anisakis simplex]